MSWICEHCGKTNTDALNHCLHCTTTKPSIAIQIPTRTEPEPTPAPVETQEALESIPDPDKEQHKPTEAENFAEALEIMGDEPTDDLIDNASSSSDFIQESNTLPKPSPLLTGKYKLPLTLVILLCAIIFAAMTLRPEKTPAQKNVNDTNFAITGSEAIPHKQEKHATADNKVFLPKKSTLSSNKISPTTNDKQKDIAPNAPKTSNKPETYQHKELKALQKISFLNYYEQKGLISKEELKFVSDSLIKNQDSTRLTTIYNKITNTDIYYLHMAKIKLDENKPKEAKIFIHKLEIKYPRSKMLLKAKLLELKEN